MNQLLFVCGFPGGGTDLTKNILNAHPNIYLNGEMPFLQNIAKYGYGPNTRFSTIKEIKSFQNHLRDLNTWGNIENINNDFDSELNIKKELHLEEVLKTCFSNKSLPVWGNKTPQNTEHITQLANLFPSAHFIIVVRDVRDICLSWNNKWGKDMYLCAHKWAMRMKTGWLACQRISPDRYLFLHYEKILTNTEEVCRTMCDFIGIPFSERMLEHHKYANSLIDGKINYGREILPENREKWRIQLSQKKIHRIEEIAYESMNTFSYQITFASSPRPIIISEKILGYVRDFLALFLVGNRARQKNNIRTRASVFIFELRKRYRL